MSNTKIIIHLVFCTKLRQKTINPEHKRDLYNYFFGIFQNKKCEVYRINGMTDHVHILFDLHPSCSLAELVKTIKGASNAWLKCNPDFPYFKGWGRGYYACSVGFSEKEACRQYIIKQEDHHKNNELMAELEYLIRSFELEWFPDDWG